MSYHKTMGWIKTQPASQIQNTEISYGLFSYIFKIHFFLALESGNYFNLFAMNMHDCFMEWIEKYSKVLAKQLEKRSAR